jgi:4'-phosphopantetheinyl transferase
MSATNQSWLSPPDQISLLKNDIHIWRVKLNKFFSKVKEYCEILSDDEYRRAERYYFYRDKKRYIISRGVLRTIIGKYYIGVEPGCIKFYYGNHGKPYLSKIFEGGTLQFNRADSNGIAVYAFTKINEIGIDLEYMRSMPDADQIVKGSLSEYEKDAFKSLSESQKYEAFFNCWTRKEAFIKATGKGLYYPLDQFDVSMAPDQPARLISINENRLEAAKWTLIDLRPEFGYSAAVALEGVCEDFRLWDFF